jgi:tRNA(Ile)-lysidine synthetase-like protein
MKFDLTKFIEEKNYTNKNEPIVVALSGGVDSMVLFNIMYSINKNIIIAHVNHNKREASIVEYKELEQIALHKNVKFEGITLEELNGNFQKESRAKRYEFFISIAKKHKSNKVFLAHHADDQIETILMRIARGSSFTGYAGIKEVRSIENITFYRPFLDIDKNQIIDFAKDNNISYFEDSSNKQDDYTRNRFRHHIVPSLRNETQNLTQKILQYSDYLSMADDFILQERDRFILNHIIDGMVDLVAFNSTHNILKIKLLKYLINQKSTDSIEVTYQQYKDMIELLSSDTPNVSYSLKAAFTLFKVYNQFYIGKDIDNKFINLEIKCVGEYSIPNNKKFIFSDKKVDIKHTDYFELCYNDTVFPLFLRNRQDGDKMRLTVGTKKVKDIFIDKKVPKYDRDSLILLADQEKVLWIPRLKKSHQEQKESKKLYIYEVI